MNLYYNKLLSSWLKFWNKNVFYIVYYINCIDKYLLDIFLLSLLEIIQLVIMMMTILLIGKSVAKESKHGGTPTGRKTLVLFKIINLFIYIYVKGLCWLQRFEAEWRSNGCKLARNCRLRCWYRLLIKNNLRNFFMKKLKNIFTYTIFVTQFS